MPIRLPRQPLLAVLAVALLCGACNGTGAATSTSPSASRTAPTASARSAASAAVSALPTATAEPTVSVGPTARVTEVPTVAPSTGTSAEPPPATLRVEGGDPVQGQLGSYTWAGGGSDSPWLPGARLHVGAGERLTLSVSNSVGVAEWSARRVPVGSTDGSGAVALGSGQGAAAFDAPTSGSWSVQVAVRFAGDLGSAAYYWRLDVD